MKLRAILVDAACWRAGCSTLEGGMQRAGGRDAACWRAGCSVVDGEEWDKYAVVGGCAAGIHGGCSAGIHGGMPLRWMYLFR